MPRIIEMQRASAVPAEPRPGVGVLYIDSGNNCLMLRVTGQATQQVGIRYTGVYEQAQVATGQGTMQTGTFFGATGVGTVPATGLCSPYRWLSIADNNGTLLLVPAYLPR